MTEQSIKEHLHIINNKTRGLTWISVVEVILNITRYVLSVFVLYPVWVRFFIVTDKNTKEDDHCYLPHKANRWKTNTNISVFGTVTHVPKALNAPHFLLLF